MGKRWQNPIFQGFAPNKELTDKELIEKLKEECKRIKIQRNEYEQELINARRLISRLKADNEINFASKYISALTGQD